MGKAIVIIVTLAVLGCTTPAILTPAPFTRCNVNIEHECVGGGCCLEGFTCGGPQPDSFQRCPIHMCCDDRDTPSMSKRKTSHQR